MLQPSTRNRWRVAMAIGECREARDGALKIGKEKIDSGTKVEHQRGVDNILTGRTAVDIARSVGVVFGDRGGQCLDERNEHVARGGRGIGDGAAIESFGTACGGDWTRCALWDHSDVRLCLGKS
jgi:hypothetical protein